MTRVRIAELCTETVLVVYSMGFLVWYIMAKLAHMAISMWS